jgi:very-short-patch-repair endonuclease
MIKFYIIIGIAVGIVFVIKELGGKGEKQKPDLSVYEKKPFLFDAVSELNLYKMLVELYGDRYNIFTQVNYSHLIQAIKTNFQDERKYRSRIDRKSADFVLCDKERVVPQLIIELDGYVHNFKSKQANDEFKDDITKIIGLPLLRIKTADANREYVKNAIDQKLNLIK